MLRNMLHVSIHKWTTCHFLYILIDTCLATNEKDVLESEGSGSPEEDKKSRKQQVN